MLPCASLFCPAVLCHSAMLCAALPCHALLCPAMPCPPLPCRAMSCPALPCPTLPCPALPLSPASGGRPHYEAGFYECVSMNRTIKWLELQCNIILRLVAAHAGQVCQGSRARPVHTPIRSRTKEPSRPNTSRTRGSYGSAGCWLGVHVGCGHEQRAAGGPV